MIGAPWPARCWISPPNWRKVRARGVPVARPHIWAAVPIKEPSRAKRRLAPLLEPEEREGLVRAMATDVLAALAATPGLAGIAIVAPASTAREFARLVNGRAIADDGSID